MEMNKNDRTKFPEKIIEAMEKYFPKGNKQRGKALVLQAISYIEGKQEGILAERKRILELIELFDLIINKWKGTFRALSDRDYALIEDYEELKQQINTQKAKGCGKDMGNHYCGWGNVCEEFILCPSCRGKGE